MVRRLLLGLLDFFLLASTVISVGAAVLPKKVHGVNIGSWLVMEPWMLPREWIHMGGQFCDDCTTCISCEFAFTKAFPKTVDLLFNKHWDEWFTKADITKLKAAGINTVRIPLGYWLVEPLVDRSSEFYPRGGFAQLKRGLGELRDAGIVAILELHAAPGVQVPNQPFAGLCTRKVEFYTQHNYHRALIWSAVLTAFTHLIPEFSSVAAIQAVNEPIMDAALTPGYGEFQTHFVQVIRAVEHALGLSVPGLHHPTPPSHMSINDALEFAIKQGVYDTEVRAVLRNSIPVLDEMATTFHEQGALRSIPSRTKTLLTTVFMDVHWQFNRPSNPAKAAIGPQLYDNHLYFSFGNVTKPDPKSYLKSMCNLNRVSRDAAVGNRPLIFGEWSLATEFEATDAFLQQWADAQKLVFSKGGGWIFWNFKATGRSARQWSYLEGLERGFFTRDPAALNDPNVCKGL
ncbi:hypothetical protein AX15_002460 [Amanita polypyramis BW_CC]|nr:hypothetical protein AX15_002460 [Amanita polypyramis BW_CC]